MGRRSAFLAGWTFLFAPLMCSLPAALLAADEAPPVAPPQATPAAVSDITGRPAPQADKHYDQWTEAKPGDSATAPAAIHAPPGFEVDLLRSARTDESSWISFTFDARGRILIAKEGTKQGENRGILRITPPSERGGESSCESIDDTLQECHGLLYAFDSLYARVNKANPDRPSGLYRLRDTDGDDRYDEVRLLRAEPAHGHGVNDLTLGLDNRLYLISGDGSDLPADWRPEDSRVRHYGYDQMFDELGAAPTKKFERPPPGYLVRTDADGKTWEVLAAGLRNPYGIDFNIDGEAFTYEADMEPHVGLPFYRPTHLLHLVSGVDYGWRDGTRPLPLYYPERPPASLTIGLGSPTAVKFGTRSNFPPRYRQALFLLDWAYGRILAIHMTPSGASYRCEQEDFLDGRPLNVTDVDFGPDGAMYFITGGRQTQSGLYRVRYVGGEAAQRSCATPRETAAQVDAASAETVDANRAKAAAARELRHKLEALHGRPDPAALDVAWPHLNSDDPWIRGAARIAVEAQPLADWQDRAFAEQRPTAALNALLAASRVAAVEVRPRLFARLLEFDWQALNDEQRLILLRCCELALIHGGPLAQGEGARIAERFSKVYPADSTPLNRELSQLLVYLKAPDVAAKTAALAARAEGQSDQLLFLEVLRNVNDGWTSESRDQYFRTLARAESARGRADYPRYLTSIETAALSNLSAGERLLAARILEADAPANGPPPPPRAFVKTWKMADLEPSLAPSPTENLSPNRAAPPRDLKRGEALFAAGQCAQCHRFANQGRLLGPDLSSVGRRFSRKDILRSIIEPSAVIDDKYRLTIVTTHDDRTLTGAPLSENDRTLVLSPDPLSPATISIAKTEIVERKLSPVSPMPKGLLDTLNLEEVLDLIAYLESDGKP